MNWFSCWFVCCRYVGVPDTSRERDSSWTINASSTPIEPSTRVWLSILERFLSLFGLQHRIRQMLEVNLVWSLEPWIFKTGDSVTSGKAKRADSGAVWFFLSACNHFNLLLKEDDKGMIAKNLDFQVFLSFVRLHVKLNPAWQNPQLLLSLVSFLPNRSHKLWIYNSLVWVEAFIQTLVEAL